MAHLKIFKKIPNKVAIALSGGIDSMVCLDFILKGNRDVVALHFNHGTELSNLYEEFVKEKCNERGVRLILSKINSPIPKGRSKEDFWREKRYEFLSGATDRKIITCHHLDDAVETWVFSSLKGTSKLIPYSRDNIIRPFILNTKSKIKDWSNQNGIEYIQDQTNFENNFSRNYIRNEMMNHVYHINPGIQKMIKKKIILKYNNN